MADDIKKEDVGGSLANMGISDFIGNVAVGIARGQFALDQACMELASFMGESEMAFGKRADSEEPDKMSLLELGFSPNFYQFTETSIELRVAISSQLEKNSEKAIQEKTEKGYDVESSGEGNWDYKSDQYNSAGNYKYASKYKDMSVASVDAKYASKYNYKAEASSVIKTKITPVPPPAVFEDILQGKLQERRQGQERLRWKMQAKNILKVLLDRLNTMLSNSASFAYVGPASGNEPTSAKRESVSSSISSALQKLHTDYNSLTLDHWAVINSLADREKADDQLKNAINVLQLLLDEMALSEPDTTFVQRVAEIKILITDLKAVFEAIYTRLYSTDEKG